MSGAAYQMCRAAGLPSPAAQGGRRGVEHNTECALLVAGTGSKCKEEREVKFDGEYSL